MIRIIRIYRAYSLYFTLVYLSFSRSYTIPTFASIKNKVEPFKIVRYGSNNSYVCICVWHSLCYVQDDERLMKYKPNLWY